MSVVEEFSGVGVDDLLQSRKKKQMLFCCCCCCFLFFVCLLLFLNAFAYVFDLGLPSEFVVDNET